MGLTLLSLASLKLGCGEDYGDGSGQPLADSGADSASVLADTGALGDGSMPLGDASSEDDAGDRDSSVDAPPDDGGCYPGRVLSDRRTPQRVLTLGTMNMTGGTISTFSNDPWAPTGSARVADGNYATSRMRALNNETEFLYASDFRFVIPTGATVVGVEFSSRRKASVPSVTSQNHYLVDTSSRVVSTTSLVTTVAPASELETYGGPTETWNQVWLDREAVLNQNFGVTYYFIIQPRVADASSTSLASVDSIEGTIYYRCP